MRLSYSELQTYRRCPRMYRYRAVDHLQRKRKSDTLFLGAAVHKLLLAHYMGQDVLTVGEEMMDEAENNTTLFVDELALEQDLICQAFEIVERYLHYWHGVEPEYGQPLHVEEEFTLLLPGVEITFTPDLVIESDRGGVMVVDHKTCAKLPDERKLWTMQSLLYSAGVKQLYPKTTGFLFNYIRKKIPTEPHLTKDGKVADIGRIDTDWETLHNFAEEHDLLGDKMVRSRLAVLFEYSRFYRRDFIPYRESASEQILDEVQVTVEQIKADEIYPRTYIESGFMDCAHCEFKSLCAAELLNYDVDTVLADEYEAREPKNVYESEGE